MGVHASSTADSSCAFMVDSISRRNVFQRRSISPKAQHFLYLSLCKPDSSPHLAFAANNLYAADANAVLRGNVLHQQPISAKFQYFFALLCGYFRSTVAVFFRCDRLKMIGIDTATHPTEMVKLQTFWNWPFNERVEVSMSVSAASKGILIPTRQERISGLFVGVPIPYPARRTVPSILQRKRIRQFVGMAVDVVSRLAFFVPPSLVHILGNLRFLPTATFAKSITHTGTTSSTSIALGVV